MKKLIGAVVLYSLAFAAWAGDRIDRIADINEDAFIKIEHVNGNATIKGWDKNQVRVVGVLGDNTKEFVFVHDSDEVMIEVKVKHNSSWNNWGDKDHDSLEIYVPYQSRVYYDAVNADVKAEGVNGGATIETVNGSINSKHLKGRVRLESVNGDITAEAVEGDLKIETVNGDITSSSSSGNEDSYESVNGDIYITSNSRDINVESVNGDIELILAEIRQLNAVTVNGEIEAHLTLVGTGEVEAYSVGGPISLFFQENVSARFDIEAHAGGKITNRLSSDQMQKAKYGPRRWLDFAVNGGNAKVNVSTVSGRVKLARD